MEFGYLEVLCFAWHSQKQDTFDSMVLSVAAILAFIKMAPVWGIVKIFVTLTASDRANIYVITEGGNLMIVMDLFIVH